MNEGRELCEVGKAPPRLPASEECSRDGDDLALASLLDRRWSSVEDQRCTGPVRRSDRAVASIGGGQVGPQLGERWSAKQNRIPASLTMMTEVRSPILIIPFSG